MLKGLVNHYHTHVGQPYCQRTKCTLSVGASSRGRSVDVFGIYDYDGSMLVHHGLVKFVPVRMFSIGGDSIDIS